MNILHVFIVVFTLGIHHVSSTTIVPNVKVCLNENSWSWGFSWSSCSVNLNVLRKIELGIKRNIVGQKKAVSAVLPTLEKHFQLLQKGESTTAPTFHFAGANGVGKSFLASTIGKGFSKGDGTDALLAVSLEGKSLKEVEALIYRKLEKCSHIVILMDDINRFPETSEIVLRIVNRYPISVPDKPEKALTNAVIILTSDIGAEGPVSEDEFKGAEQFYSKKNSTVLVYQTRFIPFKHFEHEEYLKLLIHYLTHSVACLFGADVSYEYTQLSDYVSSYIENAATFRKQGNGREFVSHLNEALDWPIREARKELDSSEKVSRINIILVRKAKNSNIITTLEVNIEKHKKSLGDLVSDFWKPSI